MKAVLRVLVALACLTACGHGHGLRFDYVEPGNAGCPAAPAPRAARPVAVPVASPWRGSLGVSCGFEKGSYTVTLTSTDPAAVFSPRTFLVNFGRLVGDGAFTVTFATVGVHTVAAGITSNMGSPAVSGRFASASNEIDVVRP